MKAFDAFVFGMLLVLVLTTGSLIFVGMALAQAVFFAQSLGKEGP